MIPLLPIVGSWLVKRLLARKPGRTEQRATFLATVISWAGLLTLLVAVLVLTWRAGRDDAAQGRQDSRSSAALAETAQDAAATVIEQAADEATVDQLVAATMEEIDNAPSDEAAGAAARAAVCRLPEYRADPACRL